MAGLVPAMCVCLCPSYSAVPFTKHSAQESRQAESKNGGWREPERSGAYIMYVSTGSGTNPRFADQHHVTLNPFRHPDGSPAPRLYYRRQQWISHSLLGPIGQGRIPVLLFVCLKLFDYGL